MAYNELAHHQKQKWTSQLQITKEYMDVNRVTSKSGQERLGKEDARMAKRNSGQGQIYRILQ